MPILCARFARQFNQCQLDLLVAIGQAPLAFFLRAEGVTDMAGRTPGDGQKPIAPRGQVVGDGRLNKVACTVQLVQIAQVAPVLGCPVEHYSGASEAAGRLRV